MRLSVWFSVSLFLSACKSTAPQFPHIDWCQGVNEDGKRFAECVSAYASDKRDYEVGRYTIFDEGYIMISRKHYLQLDKFRSDTEKWAEKYCGGANVSSISEQSPLQESFSNDNPVYTVPEVLPQDRIDGHESHLDPQPIHMERYDLQTLP